MSPLQSLYSIQKPRILLLNFTEAETQPFLARKYNVERGWMAKALHSFPSPGYEYDIVIAKFDNVGYNSARKLTQYGNSEEGYIEQIEKKLNDMGAFALVFTPESQHTLDSLRVVGIEYVDLIDLDERAKEYNLIDRPDMEKFPAFSFVKGQLVKYKDKILTPIPQGIEISLRSDANPVLYSLVNANTEAGSCVNYYKSQRWNEAGYHEDVFTPRSIILPPTPEVYERISIEILSKLPEWRPDLFPVKEVDWTQKEEYQSNRVKEISNLISEEEKRHVAAIDSLEKEKVAALSKDILLMQILIADDSDEFEDGSKMTDAVLSVLNSLGFKVQDTSKDIITGKQRADIHLTDPSDGFLALVECKGTTSENAAESYMGKILNHLLATKGAVQRGLLVVNHDRKTNPFSRLPLYNDAPHIFEEQENVGVVSTVELFKIVRAVESKLLTEEQARELLKSAGRIEYMAVKGGIANLENGNKASNEQESNQQQEEGTHEVERPL